MILQISIMKFYSHCLNSEQKWALFLSPLLNLPPGKKQVEENIENSETDLQNEEDDRLSIYGGEDFEAQPIDGEPPFKKPKVAGASRGPAVTNNDVVETRASRGLDEDVLSLVDTHVKNITTHTTDTLDFITQSLESDEKFGEPISEKLATIIKKYFVDTKEKEKIKEMLGKYPVPSNCKELTVTRVNTEVWRACLPATRDADLKLQQM